MMRLRWLLLAALCALASACATTGEPGAVASMSATTIVVAAEAAAQPVATAPADDAEAAVVEPVVPAVSDLAASAPTQDAGAVDAEEDFAAIYGQPGDGTNPATGGVSDPAAFDPWEKYNRHVHAFNMAVDRGLAKPLARAYVAAVPAPVRAGVDNFFDNLGQPATLVNSLLQGNPRGAANALGRFLLNSTVGIGGLFDVASKAKMPNRDQDFGQTLAVWGWQRSRYLEVPFLGPQTVRDVLGLAGDSSLWPVQYIEDDKTRVSLQGPATGRPARRPAVDRWTDEPGRGRRVRAVPRHLAAASQLPDQAGGAPPEEAAPEETLPPYLLQDEAIPPTPSAMPPPGQ